MVLNGRPLVPVILTTLLAIPIFFLTIFSLASSTTASLSNLYILSAKWSTSSTTDVALRMAVSYYGICWTKGPSNPVTCTRTTGRSAVDIATALFDPANRGELTVRGIQFGLDLQRDVFVGFTTAGAVAFGLSLVLTVLAARGGGAVDGRERGRGRAVRAAAVTLTIGAAVLMVASSWATTQGVRALEVLDRYTAAGQQGYFQGGDLLVALQWLAAVLCCLYAWAAVRVINFEERRPHYAYKLEE